jgi:hypothetical protein
MLFMCFLAYFLACGIICYSVGWLADVILMDSTMFPCF